MEDNEKITVEIEVDLGGIESKLKTIDIGIADLKSKVIETKASFSSGFSSMQSTLKVINESVLTKGQTIENAIKILTSTVSLGLNSIVQEIKSVFETLNELKREQTVSGFANDAFQATDLTIKLMELIQQYRGFTSPSGAGKGPLLLGSGDNNPTGDGKGSSASGSTGIHGLISTGGLGDLTSFGAAMDDLMESVGGVTARIKESTAAWWQLTTAKVADKAEDAAIIALYVGDYVKGIAAMVAQLAKNTAGWVANTAAKVASTAAEWAQIAATTAWKAICVAATAVTSAFGAAMAVLTSPITLVVAAVAALIAIVVLLIKNWDTVKEVAVKTWDAIVDAFGKAGDWFKRTVLDPVVNGIKGTVNGVIGFINGLISGVVKGINSIINLINKLNFTVPDWIPGIGGETFGFNITPLTAPQIPYLAKGAVLPANRPFLAVVGDQKYGTNVEAPLATIQEAVALTMEDFTASNLAGHQATVGVLREILEAVLGIHIGEGDIARAAERYRRKMAVVYGGNW